MKFPQIEVKHTRKPIELTKLIGNWKVRQKRPAADRTGIVRGLNDSNDADNQEMARWVEEKHRS